MAATTYTKGKLVEMALEELGIASYVFDIEAEEDVAALRRLDLMVEDWQGNLSALGYVQPATAGTSLPSDLPGIDHSIVRAVILNLALEIAPSYGKLPSGRTIKAAASGFSMVSGKYALPVEISMPNRMPTGQGGRRYGRFHAPAAE